MNYRIALAGVCLLFFSCAGTQVVKTDTQDTSSSKEQVPKGTALEKQGSQKTAPKTITVQVPVEIKSVIKFADGSIDEYTTSEYDDEFKTLLFQTRYSASGALVEHTEYKYIEGKLVEKTIKDHEDKIISKRTFTYGPSGLVTDETVIDGNGKLISAFEYAYDAQNNKIAWIVKNNNNTKVAETRYAYKDGKVQSAELTDAKGKKNGYSTYEYDSVGNLSVISYYNASGSLLRKEVSYWDKGLLKKEERSSVGGQVMQRTAYEYGPNQEIIRKTIEDLQGKSKQIIEYEYTNRTEIRMVE